MVIMFAVIGKGISIEGFPKAKERFVCPEGRGWTEGKAPEKRQNLLDGRQARGKSGRVSGDERQACGKSGSAYHIIRASGERAAN